MTQDDPGPDDGDRESYHGYSVDDENQPQDTGDSQADDRGLAEPLDEGYSPPEKWSVAEGFGNTPLEELMGETLDMRLREEVPEADPYAEAERGAGADEEFPSREVGDARAGRLFSPYAGSGTDDDTDLVAEDAGIDGAGASAEEAAMHVVPDEEE
ncbi:DUF5709 domain-containing protein [Nocardioides panaciterrulae]|uniref:DUF5709 domain-containing protein n=1 Tax=Nocardioides panaciterrulae TaxID=661492 RepID=A0A7Y9E9S6_9ACTN|nr:hypothetical protein [Nocardioides panaciterrulae]